MIVFNTDLDNTLIYSYKHDIGNEKINVELYQGREISFVTKKTYRMLKDISEKILVVPTTTRTQQQYERINLGIENIKYALVCNGGVLLVNGKRDEKWISHSKEIISDCMSELSKAIDLLEKENRRNFEVRFIEEMFVFTKCIEPEKVVEYIKDRLNCSLVDVFSNGTKIYVVPKKLNKGNAISRLKEYLGGTTIIAAGDSEFDIQMVETADIGIVPLGFKEKYGNINKLIQVKGKHIFSEELLELTEQIIKEKQYG